MFSDYKTSIWTFIVLVIAWTFRTETGLPTYMENKTFKGMVYSFRIKFVMYKWLTETKLNMNVPWMYQSYFVFWNPKWPPYYMTWHD